MGTAYNSTNDSNNTLICRKEEWIHATQVNQEYKEIKDRVKDWKDLQNQMESKLSNIRSGRYYSCEVE